MVASAHFSKCGTYRYWLYRSWKPNGKVAACIGLNPSTANGEKNDPTIESLIRLLKNNGYDGFFMLNLYGLISPDPAALRAHPDPHGANDKHRVGVIEPEMDVIFCWGNFPIAEHRGKQMAKEYPKALCFGRNANGSPKHPLYLKATTRLVPFDTK